MNKEDIVLPQDPKPMPERCRASRGIFGDMPEDFLTVVEEMGVTEQDIEVFCEFQEYIEEERGVIRSAYYFAAGSTSNLTISSHLAKMRAMQRRVPRACLVQLLPDPMVLRIRRGPESRGN